MKKIIAIIACSALSTTLFFAAAACAQDDSREQQKKAARELAAVEAEMQQQEEMMLESLKMNSPELYQKRVQERETQKKIDKTMESFRNGTISKAEAESRLYPLIKNQSQDYLDSLGAQIQSLEAQIERLRAAKKNPDEFVRQRVRAMLDMPASVPQENPPNIGFDKS